MSFPPSPLSGTPLDPNLDEMLEDNRRQSHFITRLLVPAVRLWLKSQVEQIHSLSVEINGGDRQILSGVLPQAVVIAEQAIYQGLHLSKVQVQASSIRVNLGQVLRGKPLRLLNPIPVDLDVYWKESDLNASLQQNTVKQTVIDYLTPLLQQADLSPTTVHSLNITLHRDRLLLSFGVNGQSAPVTIESDVIVVEQNEQTNLRWHLVNLDQSVELPLGTDVAIASLRLEPEGLWIQGRLTIQP